MAWNLSRIGAVNGAGDTKALNLKIFSGEILTAFSNNTVMVDKHRVRTISNAKSAQFLATGRNSAAYHVPGTVIDGTEAKVNEVVIAVDGELISSVAIPSIDEALASVDLRKPLSDQLGVALAQTYDKTVAQVGLLAARKTVVRVDGELDMVGNTFVVADTAAGIKGGIYSAAQQFDEKNVPDFERNGFFRPAQYYQLLQDSTLGNRDFGTVADIGSGSVRTLANIGIFKTNNLPSTLITTSFENKYDGDFTKTRGLIMTPDAVGTVKVDDISFNMTGDEYFTTHRATLLTAAYLMGHGELRAECAAELAVI